MIDRLTGNQLQLVIAGMGLLGLVVGALLGSVGFVAKRWITGSAKQEKVAYMASVAELASKLRTLGMTVAEIDELEELLRSPGVAGSAAAVAVMTGEPATPIADRFATTFAMRERASASYAVAEAELEQALVDLRLLVEDLDVEGIDEAHRAWKAYRDELMEAAAARYAGGSHAPLAGTLAGLAETERRRDEVRVDVHERQSR